MELSGPVLPPWSRYGCPSLNTRPFLTVHRSSYGVVPRLFPACLNPYRVAQPITDASAIGASPEPKGRAARSTSVDRGRFRAHVGIPGPAVDGREDSAKGPGRADAQRRALLLPPDLEPPLALEGPGEGESFGSSSASASTGSSDSASLRRHERNRLPGPPPGNTACSVLVGDDASVVFAQAGRFRTIAAYGIPNCRSQREDPTRARIERLAVPTNSGSGIRLSAEDPIRIMQSTGRIAEPYQRACFAAGSANRVYIGSICRRRTMNWISDFSVNSLYSISFSRFCPEEVITLSADGLRLHLLETDGSVSYRAGCDIWPLEVEHRYFKVSYGAHARTVLVASDAGLHRIDLRQGHGSSSGVQGGSELDASAELLANVWTDWRMSSQDGGVRIFEPHPRIPFWSILATDHSLNIVDERMVRTPLLSWTLTSGPHAPNTVACVANVPSASDDHGDMIALAAPKEGRLSIFHTVSGRGSTFGLLADQNASDGSSKATGHSSGTSSGPLYVASIPARLRSLAGHSKMEARFPIPSILWSDLPLSNLYTYAPTEQLCGLALLTCNGMTKQSMISTDGTRSAPSYISVVQVSAAGGAIAQLIGCGVYDDGSVAFESAAQQIVSAAGKPIADSSSALWEAQAAACGGREGSQLCDLHWRSRTVQSTKYLHTSDATDLRNRICSGRDDDVSEGESTSIPRPHVLDQPLIAKLNAALAEGGSQVAGGDWARIGSLQSFLSRPRTLSEIALFTRAGYPHAPTPVRLDALRDMLETSPYVDSYEVRCPELGAVGPSVTVYTSGEAADAEDNELTKAIDGTPFANLLSDLERIYSKNEHDEML